MEQRTFRVGAAILLVAWALVSAVFYSKTLTQPPAGVHSWAMADYYAMSMNFAEKGLNLFRPQTFNLGTPEGVTASDLPLPAWLSGALMLISGSESPVIFRLLTLFVGFLGFFFFFRSISEQGVSIARAVALTLLCWLLPGLLYYHDGFLPSSWALSLFLIGLWALQRGSSGPFRYWAISVAAFTLAALLRKPYVLHLIGIGVWQMLLVKDRKKTMIWASGLAVFFLWQCYDLYLMRTYGSIFLRHFMSPQSFSGAITMVAEVWRKWGAIWFSPAHVAWLALAIVLALKTLRKSSADLSGRFRTWHWVGTLFFGLFYFILMLRQFSDHDYYAIDSFYPVVLVGVLYLSRHMSARPWLVWAEATLLVWAGYTAYQTMQWYQGAPPNMVADRTNQVYRQSRPLLDGLGVAKDAKMMVFEAYSFNIPLIGMGRSGYCLLSSQPAEQSKILDKHPDYAVCLDTNFIASVVQDKFNIVNSLEFVGRNQDLWVFRPGNFPDNTLETLLASSWTTLVDTSLQTSEEYICSNSQPVQPGRKVVFHGMAGMPEGGEIKVTVALFKAGAPVVVLEKPLKFPATHELRYTAADINVPPIPADEMRIYLWNPGRRAVFFQKFHVNILQLKPAQR